MAYKTTLALMLMALQANAGVQIESTLKRAGSNPTVTTQIMQVENGNARIEMGNATAIIFKDETLYILDLQRKSYLMLDRPTLERLSQTMTAAMERMRAQAATMPPEQRAMMEQMLAQQGIALTPTKAAIYDARPTGASETFQGKACKVWDITRDGELLQQVCAASFSSLPGVSELRTLQKKMDALLEKAQGPLRQRLHGAMQLPAEVMNKINGYPVIARAYERGAQSGDETLVTNWQSTKIDRTRFEIPSDFAKQELPSLQSPPGR